MRKQFKSTPEAIEFYEKYYHIDLGSDWPMSEVESIDCLTSFAEKQCEEVNKKLELLQKENERLQGAVLVHESIIKRQDILIEKLRNGKTVTDVKSEVEILSSALSRQGKYVHPVTRQVIYDAMREYASQFKQADNTSALKNKINWTDIEDKINDALFESNGSSSGTFYVIEVLKKTLN